MGRGNIRRVKSTSLCGVENPAILDRWLRSKDIDDKRKLNAFLIERLRGGRLPGCVRNQLLDAYCHTSSFITANLCSQLKYDEALEACLEAEEFIPDDKFVMLNKGHLYYVMGRPDKAKPILIKCHEMYPPFLAPVIDLINIYGSEHNYAKSKELLLEERVFNPDNFNLYSELVVVYGKLKDIDSAIKTANEALNRPECPRSARGNILCNIGDALSDLGDVNGCLKYSRMSADEDPTNIVCRQNYLLNTLYVQGRDDYLRTTVLEHMKMGAEIKQICAVNPRKLHANAHERIRIGYVTADLFVGHPMQYFAMPLLRDFDRSRFEVYVYSSSKVVTDRSNGNFIDYGPDVHWRDITHYKDEQAVDLVVGDEIDVLVDLSAHTAKNRVCLFSERLAKLMFCYLGYPCHTGMPDIDFYLIDDSFDMTFRTKSLHNTCFTCYVPVKDQLTWWTGQYALFGPRRDAVKQSYFTIGTLNKPSKLNQDLVDEWSGTLLDELRDAMLCVRIDKVHRYRNLDRVLFLSNTNGYLDHLTRYTLIDVALDTRPYSGTTTTCEALYMGTPVITVPDRKGKTVHQNVSASILHYSGMDDFIASDARDIPGIIRKILRDVDSMGSEAYKRMIRSRFLSGDVCNIKKYMDEYQRVVIEEFGKTS